MAMLVRLLSVRVGSEKKEEKKMSHDVILLHLNRIMYADLGHDVTCTAYHRQHGSTHGRVIATGMQRRF